MCRDCDECECRWAELIAQLCMWSLASAISERTLTQSAHLPQPVCNFWYFIINIATMYLSLWHEYAGGNVVLLLITQSTEPINPSLLCFLYNYAFKKFLVVISIVHNTGLVVWLCRWTSEISKGEHVFFFFGGSQNLFSEEICINLIK